MIIASTLVLAFLAVPMTQRPPPPTPRPSRNAERQLATLLGAIVVTLVVLQLFAPND